MPAERPTITGIQNLVELDIANSLDFHIASTNFISVLNDYTDYIALNYIWTQSKHTCDPITRQAEFFEKLNKSGFDLRNWKQDGVRSANQDHVNYNLIHLNSYLQPNEIWIRTAENLPEMYTDTGRIGSIQGVDRVFFKALNLETDLERVIEYKPPLVTDYVLLDSYLSYGEQWQKNEDGYPLRDPDGNFTAVGWDEMGTDPTYRSVSPQPVDYTPLSDTVEEYINNLSDKFGCNEMTDEFLLHWYEKYKSAHYIVKQEYKKLVGSDYEKDYFEDFNDSIGALGRIFEYPDPTIIPMWDITFDQTSNDRLTIPRSIPPSVFDKLDKEVQAVLLESSSSVNSLFRLNIIHVIDEVSTPSHAHGTNLMTDYLYYNRVAGLFSTIAGIISDTLGVTYRLLGFVMTADNLQNVADPKLVNIIETHRIQVDHLNRKLSSIKKNISSKDILDAKTVDQAFQG